MLVKDKVFIGKGKRSYVYSGSFNNKKVAVKEAKKGFEKRIENEAYWLKRLNKYGIGPKFLFYENGCLIYEFVDGERIIDWVSKNNRNNIKKVLLKVLLKCKKLDELKVNKFELHNPIKHILINKDVNMIDFERCAKSNKPKNVTQFCQFLISKKFYLILSDKGFDINKNRLIDVLKKYKEYYSNEAFNNVKKIIFKNN